MVHINFNAKKKKTTEDVMSAVSQIEQQLKDFAENQTVIDENVKILTEKVNSKLDAIFSALNIQQDPHSRPSSGHSRPGSAPHHRPTSGSKSFHRQTNAGAKIIETPVPHSDESKNSKKFGRATTMRRILERTDLKI